MKIKFTVGEPRGFDAGDGTNVITGALVDALCGSKVIDVDPRLGKVLQTPQGEQPAEKITEYWFVVTCGPVKYEDTVFTSLLLTPRYKVKKPPVDILNAGEELIVHAVWRSDGGVWDQESIQAANDGLLEVTGVIVASAKRVHEG